MTMAARHTTDTASGKIARALETVPLRKAGRETPLEELARLAAYLCRVPYSQINTATGTASGEASHVGGFGMEKMGERFTPLIEAAFAALALGTSPNDLFLVPDASTDSRFCTTSAVAQAPHVRFFASVPVMDSLNRVVGTLSVFDDGPRLLADREVTALRALARQAGALHDLSRRLGEANDALTAREKAEQAAKWQARHDVLTGLPNRALFLERAERALALSRVRDSSSKTEVGEAAPTPRKRNSAAVLFVDLDRFKRINDTLGHAAGDQLLREVAARFGACLGPEDTLARLGGDEFTVFLPSTHGPTYAQSIAQMMLRALRRPILVGKEELYVGASIGIAQYPRDGSEAHTLLKNADIAMYQAKSDGGVGGCCRSYSRRMNQNGYQRLLEEGELRRAIENNELSVVFQPQIDAVTGQVVSVEALARWRHPERGMIPPAHFIALAEQADLIAPLGECILRLACDEAARWRETGHQNVRVSVNVSAREVCDARMAERVANVLRDYDLPGDALELELTETALVHSGDATPETLDRLRGLGVHLSVDDFGTGASSFAFLRRFRVDSVKIDHSFAAGMLRGATDVHLTQCMIDMAHSLGLRAVAEGIESPTQRDLLVAMGCDGLQGYLIGGPKGGESIHELLNQTLPDYPD